MNKKMDYTEIRNTVEKLGNENYRDLIKALVSYEKGVNDENALDEIYEEFMDSDTKGLLHEDFDYMIEKLRENGRIDDTIKFIPDKDNFTTAIGNLLKDVEIIERENKNKQPFKVANLTLVSEDDNGERVYTNASAFGDKIDNLKDFKKGDFVKLSGQLKVTKDENGKEYTNLRIVSSKLLKAKEQGKEGKESILGAIDKFKAEEKLSPVVKNETEKAAKQDIDR